MASEFLPVVHLMQWLPTVRCGELCVQNAGLFWEVFGCCFLNVHVVVYVGKGKTEEVSLHLEWKVRRYVMGLVLQ